MVSFGLLAVFEDFENVINFQNDFFFLKDSGLNFLNESFMNKKCLVVVH